MSRLRQSAARLSGNGEEHGGAGGRGGGPLGDTAARTAGDASSFGDAYVTPDTRAHVERRVLFEGDNVHLKTQKYRYVG